MWKLAVKYINEMAHIVDSKFDQSIGINQRKFRSFCESQFLQKALEASSFISLVTIILTVNCFSNSYKILVFL
jgi:hypothetical protein